MVCFWRSQHHGAYFLLSSNHMLPFNHKMSLPSRNHVHSLSYVINIYGYSVYHFSLRLNNPPNMLELKEKISVQLVILSEKYCQIYWNKSRCVRPCKGKSSQENKNNVINCHF